MPYATASGTKKFQPSDDLPTHLEHRPRWALPYEKFDGHYIGNTDMRWMSVGLAQYNGAEVSLKTFRHSTQRWTRQAEELPLYRLFDGALFSLFAIFDSESGRLTVPAGTFEGQTEDIVIDPEQLTHSEQFAYASFLQRELPRLKARLRALGDKINQLRKAGKL